MRKKKKGAFAFGLKIFRSCVTIQKEVSGTRVFQIQHPENGFQILSEKVK